MHRARLATLLLLIAGVWSGPIATASHAHEGSAVFEILEADASGQEVVLQVGIRYSNDDEGAQGAIVKATGTGPDGETVGPVPLERADDGYYEAVLALPVAGAWELNLTSAFPPGSTTIDLTAPEDIAGEDRRGVIAAGIGAALVLAVAGFVLWRRRARDGAAGTSV